MWLKRRNEARCIQLRFEVFNSSEVGEIEGVVFGYASEYSVPVKHMKMKGVVFSYTGSIRFPSLVVFVSSHRIRFQASSLRNPMVYSVPRSSY